MQDHAGTSRRGPGSPQGLLTRASTRSRKNLLERTTSGSPQNSFSEGQPFCASLRNRNAHGHVTRAISCENLQVKCRRPDVIAARFVRACAVEIHMDMSQEPISCENLQAKCRRPDVSRMFCASKCTWTCHKSQFHVRIYRQNAADQTLAARFVRACGRNAHGHVTRAHFIRKFMGKNAGQRMEHPDQALALTPTVSNPSV